MLKSGFSYIELLIALALFAILLIAALPVLGQAGRNLTYAQDGYAAHLAAQSLMLAVRDALLEATGTAGAGYTALSNAQAIAAAYASRLGTESYTVWVFTLGSAPVSFGTPCAPAANAALSGLSGMSFSEETSAVLVAVWNEHGFIAGRAIGIA